MPDALENADVVVLGGVLASLEDYFRLDEGDPTARAHALKHVARRAAADLAREHDLASPDGAQIAAQLHEIGLRLRAQTVR